MVVGSTSAKSLQTETRSYVHGSSSTHAGSVVQAMCTKWHRSPNSQAPVCLNSTQTSLIVPCEKWHRSPNSQAPVCLKSTQTSSNLFSSSNSFTSPFPPPCNSGVSSVDPTDPSLGVFDSAPRASANVTCFVPAPPSSPPPSSDRFHSSVVLPIARLPPLSTVPATTLMTTHVFVEADC